MRITAFILLFMVCHSASSQQLTIYTTQGEKFEVIVNGDRYFTKPMSDRFEIELPNTGNYNLRVVFEQAKFLTFQRKVNIDEKKNYIFSLKQKPNNHFDLFLERKIEIQKPNIHIQEADTDLPDEIILDKSLNIEQFRQASPSIDSTITKKEISSEPVEKVDTFLDKTEIIEPIEQEEQVQNEEELDNVAIKGQLTPSDTEETQPIINPNCDIILSNELLTEKIEIIKTKDFEDSKLSIGNKLLETYCLTSNQLKRILQLFDFEDTKITFAKSAYPRINDKANIDKIYEAFDFEMSVEEVREFISKH